MPSLRFVDGFLFVFFVRGQDALAPGCSRSGRVGGFLFDGAKIGGGGGGWCANLHFCWGNFFGEGWGYKKSGSGGLLPDFWVER